MPVRIIFCYNQSMDNNLLNEVVQAEKEIQKDLDLEKAKAREWLEHAIKESEAEFAREKQRSTDQLHRSMEEARRKAGLKASEVKEQASVNARRLENVSNEVLSQILEKHIGRVLPG